MAEMIGGAEDDALDAQRGKYLTFVIGKETFGIEIRYVTEIVGMQQICTLPDTPAYVKGIVNLRGKIIPVIDMRLRFGKEEAPYTDRTCIVVVDLPGVTAGLIVDCVEEVASIPDESISAPPDTRSGFQSRFLRGIGKTDDGVRLLLDCERIFQTSAADGIPHAAQ